MVNLTQKSWVDSTPIHGLIKEDEKSKIRVLKAFNDVQENKYYEVLNVNNNAN